MAGLIPEDVIDKIRDEVSVVDVVGHFLSLQQKGASYWGLCPFHREKTPSFHVHPDRQIFYCFGCGRGGNVFRFLMELEGMAFPEAVEWCAGRIGLDLSRFMEENKGVADRRSALLAATAWATQWYADQLNESSGAKAREYAQERGLRPETIEAFGVGFAPEDSQAMVRAANAAQMATEPLLQTSVLRRQEGRSPFAYFRSRLIFPIRGVAQKIYGFGGRILGPGEPKYLNSPETAIFHKRKTLFALPDARANIIRAKTAILVEGYLDALLLHQAGWNQAVATCGTALTAEQVVELGRYADQVVVLFDGDGAGVKAAFKAADTALAGGLDVKIARLPAGKDPADLLAAGEVDTLQSTIDEAPGLVESMRREVQARGARREMKERALRHLRDMMPRISDPIRAELLIQEAAAAFSVPQSLLRPGSRAAQRNDAPVTSREEGPRADMERQLLALALAGRKGRQLLSRSLTQDDFHHLRHQHLFEALRELEDSVDVVGEGDLAGLDEDAQRVLARLLIEMPGPELDAAAEISAALERLQDLRQRDDAKTRREQLDEAYRTGEDWRSRLPREGTDVGPTRDS